MRDGHSIDVVAQNSYSVFQLCAFIFFPKLPIGLSMYILIFSILLPNLAFADELKIGGGAAPINNIFKKIKTSFEKSSGITLTLVEDGPDSALKGLDDGNLQGAAAGLNFDGWLQMMTEKKIDLKNKGEFKHRVIGKDLVPVFTHPEIKLSTISQDQLAKLFAGEIKNWKEIGGPDVPVKVVIGTKIPGTYKFFKDKILDGKDYTKTGTIEATDLGDVVAKIKATPGSIGLGAMSAKDSSLGIPSTPEVGRPITFITRGAPSPSMIKLFDFINGDGKKLIQ